ncbi:DeoR/GlpR family DNA-binding transcription regulator [Caldibacillus thermoamylovorans]|uniref:DeoR/GlpR family DNA-binding transcription regulator n=1 Tax=Caldibacillus thermoamylovorans TaxID=35841 RepID=UPI00203C8908|nr:DeoR/GlpR family DNA-binding transcription regulator [Caldibacillus thermoamylovorans]MCM3799929.1 DeoR/GlpR family DNA-binding transcription regulator [Caldibacillus thermoamylovorans]
MLQIERLEKVLEYIDEKGTVNISELVDEFNVSKPTVLRDLKELENQNLIIRVHGGAASKRRKGTNFEPKMSFKEKKAVEQKEKIAELAYNHINSGETILLDTGSTTLMLAQKILSLRNVTVITNDIKIAMTLSDNDHIDLVVIGGQKRKGVYSLIGPIAENILKQLNIDKVFLGADAVDYKAGLTNSNIDETNIKKTMLEVAKEKILLADSSKFNNVAFTKIADLEVLDRIITDDLISKKDLEMLNEMGVIVETPKKEN